MQTVRKSADGNVLMVKRPSGYAVSRRLPHWNAANAYRVAGVETLEWETMGKGMSEAAATALFDNLTA